MSIYQGDTLIAGAGAPSRNIGEIVPSMLPLFDAGLHLLDGSLISGSGTYAAFVTYIAGLVSTYPNCFVTEANWQTAVTTYGVCGKFVYDSTNNTVRLPKVTGIIEGTVDVTALGDLVEAGLPNITGSIGYTRANGFGNTGAFYTVNGLTDSHVENTGGSTYGTGIDASRSSSIYKNSFNKVQPQTIKAYYYIVLSNSIKTAIQADIDEIATDLNLKAGTDLANLTNTGLITAAKTSMPSGIYDTLTIGAVGTTYTAPADGYFWLGGIADNVSAITRIVMRRITDRFGVSFGSHNVSATGGWTGGVLPVKKGDTIAIYYANITADHGLRFYYAVGSTSEKAN